MPPFEPERRESSERGDLLVPAGFLFLSIVLMVLPMPAQQQLSAVLRSTVLAPFVWTQESIRQTRVRAREIADLQAQLDSAMAVLFAQRTLEEENRRLRALLELHPREIPGFVSASVIRPGTRGSESMFLLDVGSSEGVEVNDPVVVAGGLVGVVREVGLRTALAMDWTHPDFRVSVMTDDGVAFGIVEPRLGAFREEARLVLSSVPYHTPVEVGASVVTSGQGGVYPRGIPVGTVAGLAESEAGWRRSYWLDPAVSPVGALHVLVLTGEALGTVESLEHLWRPDPDPGAEPFPPDPAPPALPLPDPSGSEPGAPPPAEAEPELPLPDGTEPEPPLPAGTEPGEAPAADSPAPPGPSEELEP